MTKTLTRADIVNCIAKDLKLPREQAMHLFGAALETMMDSLAEEGEVKIASFGSFKVRQKSKRIGRNPKTGKEAVITARRVVSFKYSPLLINNLQAQKTV